MSTTKLAAKNSIKKKWWGWGLESKSFDLSHRPDFLPFLETELSVSIRQHKPAVSLKEIKLPPIKISEEIIKEFEEIVGRENVSSNDLDRITHAFGKSYRDLVRIRKGEITSCHDLVIFPFSQQNITEIIRVADKHKIKVIPFGGGTSVVGGVEAIKPGMTICIDMAKHMTKLLNLDKTSLLATFQAGVSGPELEEELNERGYTLSHYPQSFEFSTLGGWVAARSAGQQSTKYGKIEKLVNSLKMVSPSGEIETRKIPAKATGPDINQMIIGSEGIYGIITEATVKIHHLPEAKDYRGYLFQSFDDGIRFIKELIHEQEVYPATVRLSDKTETKLLFKLGEKKNSFIKDKMSDLVKTYMKEIKHFSFDNMVFLLLGFEGTNDRVSYDTGKVNELLKSYKTVNLGKKMGDRWYESRFDLPYLRDSMLDMGIMVDTLETSTTWANLEHLYLSVKKGLKEGIEKTGVKGFVACHISHIYHEGASLYYTFVAKQNQEKELEQWQIIKNEATDAIVENHGAISHHHGVGADHARWLPAELGETGMNMIKGIKEKLDPNMIMNPQNIIHD